MNTKLSDALIAVALIVMSLFVFGCNTVRGAGEDIEEGGEAIQRGADEVQDK